VLDYADTGYLTSTVLSLIALSCVCAYFLNYSMALCLQQNSALTTTAIGPIKVIVGENSL